jgi:hypothetical protein
VTDQCYADAYSIISINDRSNGDGLEITLSVVLALSGRGVVGIAEAGKTIGISTGRASRVVVEGDGDVVVIGVYTAG